MNVFSVDSYRIMCQFYSLILILTSCFYMNGFCYSAELLFDFYVVDLFFFFGLILRLIFKYIFHPFPYFKSSYIYLSVLEIHGLFVINSYCIHIFISLYIYVLYPQYNTLSSYSDSLCIFSGVTTWHWTNLEV